MGYSTHSIVLTDLECLTALKALSIYAEDTDTHPDDKNLADRVMTKINITVKQDKRNNEPKRVATYNKCESCKWLDMSNKKSIGYECTNPDKRWRSPTARWHNKSCKACKYGYKAKDDES